MAELIYVKATSGAYRTGQQFVFIGLNVGAFDTLRQRLTHTPAVNVRNGGHMEGAARGRLS
jgi:hypothetical protein